MSGPFICPSENWTPQRKGQLAIARWALCSQPTCLALLGLPWECLSQPAGQAERSVKHLLQNHPCFSQVVNISSSEVATSCVASITQLAVALFKGSLCLPPFGISPVGQLYIVSSQINPINDFFNWMRLWLEGGGRVPRGIIAKATWESVKTLVLPNSRQLLTFRIREWATEFPGNSPNCKLLYNFRNTLYMSF